MRATALPTWAALYSLLHLNGFPGDTKFYRSAIGGASRVLELGAGDGRVGEALCEGRDVEYVGVDLCKEFVATARGRLTPHARARVVVGDMLTPGVAGDSEPFDVVLLTANTLFCTPHHAELLARCGEALRPGGALLFDVYNARDWHEDALLGPDGFDEDGDAGAGSDGAAGGEDALVVAVDTSGREWTVYERDPEVDPEAHTIRCTYDFEAASGERACAPRAPHSRQPTAPPHALSPPSHCRPAFPHAARGHSAQAPPR